MTCPTKLLVFSDSHGAAAPMAEVCRAYSPDIAAHLGDYSSDADELGALLPGLRLISVRGNCDYGSKKPDYEILELEGRRIFLTHGHRYSVKFSLDSLLNTASAAGCELALFGHTHERFDMDIGGLRAINPGSFGFGRSFALVEIAGDGISCEFIQAE